MHDISHWWRSIELGEPRRPVSRDNGSNRSSKAEAADCQASRICTDFRSGPATRLAISAPASDASGEEAKAGIKKSQDSTRAGWSLVAGRAISLRSRVEWLSRYALASHTFLSFRKKQSPPTWAAALGTGTDFYMDEIIIDIFSRDPRRKEVRRLVGVSLERRNFELSNPFRVPTARMLRHSTRMARLNNQM